MVPHYTTSNCTVMYCISTTAPSTHKISSLSNYSKTIWMTFIPFFDVSQNKDTNQKCCSHHSLQSYHLRHYLHLYSLSNHQHLHLQWTYTLASEVVQCVVWVYKNTICGIKYFLFRFIESTNSSATKSFKIWLQWTTHNTKSYIFVEWFAGLDSRYWGGGGL